jgi:hypothetical protein
MCNRCLGSHLSLVLSQHTRPSMSFSRMKAEVSLRLPFSSTNVCQESEAPYCVSLQCINMVELFPNMAIAYQGCWGLQSLASQASKHLGSKHRQLQSGRVSSLKIWIVSKTQRIRFPKKEINQVHSTRDTKFQYFVDKISRLNLQIVM